MDFKNINNLQKSYIFIIVGSILFLYSLGIFKQVFQFIIVIGSLGLILYGLYIGDFLTKAKKFINQFKNKRENT